MDCVAHQASLPMEFFRQEYWSGLPFPSPDPEVEPASLASPAWAGGFFTTSTTWEALKLVIQIERHMGRAVAHGRYLKTACLWILRKEEKDEQPMSFSKFVRAFYYRIISGLWTEHVCAGKETSISLGFQPGSHRCGQ